MNTPESIVVNPATAADAIATAFRANEPVMMWGSPGIGKSDVARQAARAYAGGDCMREYNVGTCADPDKLVKDVRLLLYDQVDIKGLYDLSRTNGEGKTFMTKPAIMPDHGDGTVVILLDELPAAAPSVQAAAYQLVLDRKIGDYKLPEYVRIIAAGNRKSDKSVSHDMPAALRDRFLHLEMRTNVDAWVSWALAHDIRMEVIAFIKLAPEYLNAFDPTQLVSPTPRGWSAVSRLLDAGMSRDVERQMICGRIGHAAGSMFLTTLSVIRQMPSPDAVLLNPDTAPVPKEPSARYAIGQALARKATPQNFQRIRTYLERFTDPSGIQRKDLTVLVVKTALRCNAEVQESRAFAEFASAYQDVL